MRGGLEGFWAIVGNGRWERGSCFCAWRVRGGRGGVWTGAGEACQCRRSYGYVRKSNELRIARAVNLVTELVCPGGGASNAEQARQDGGWRRSCIPNKKRGPPPARYPMSGVGAGPQASDNQPSSRTKSDDEATAQTTVCGPASQVSDGMPSLGNGPRQQDLPPLSSAPPPGNEYLPGSVSAFGSSRARLNRNEKHEQVERYQPARYRTHALNFEIADAKGAHWRRRLSDFFSASQLGNLHD